MSSVRAHNTLAQTSYIHFCFFGNKCIRDCLRCKWETDEVRNTCRGKLNGNKNPRESERGHGIYASSLFIVSLCIDEVRIHL